jgi:mannose-6-phosphate isomerase-like protein (cupin superfamily)
VTVLPDEGLAVGVSEIAVDEAVVVGFDPLSGVPAEPLSSSAEASAVPAGEVELADMVLGAIAPDGILVDIAADAPTEPGRATFDRLLTALRDLHDQNEAMQAFAPWPDSLEWVERDPVRLPVAGHVEDWQETGTGKTAEVHRAMAEAAALAEWRLTYTEEEVGAHFLENYGYFELFGPDGHYRTNDARAYVAYWGPGLFYDWHHHEAEELYVVVSGSGLFHIEGGADAQLNRGDTRLHGSWQKHAMTTGDEPILTFVMWRGAGLEGLPRMGNG